MTLKQHLKSYIVDEYNGEILCGCGCGHVIEEKTSTMKSEERPDDHNPNSSRRAGFPGGNLLHDGGLSTKIGKANFDSTMKKISIDNQQLFFKLRSVDEWARVLRSNSEKRRMIVGLSETVKICDIMGLNKTVREHTAVLYRKCVVNGISKNKKIDCFVVACCFLACKDLNLGITIKDICLKMELKESLVVDYIYAIKVTAELSHNILDSPSRFIKQIANSLYLKNNVVALSNKIIESASLCPELTSKHPKGIAAAALFMASNEIYGKVIGGRYGKCRRNRLQLEDLAEVSEISSVTIRKNVLILQEFAIQKGLVKP